MAKGDVVMKFSAEQAAFVQACEQARQKLQATADTARSAGGEVMTFGDKTMKSMQDVTKSVTGVAMGMVGVGSVVSLVAGNFSAGLDRMTGKSDKLRESLESVEAVLYKLNRMEQLPEIRTRLSSMAEGVTTREGVEGIYNSAANHLGTRATEGQLEASVKASLGVIKGGGTHEEAASFASIFGDFRTMRGKMEKVSDADLAEVSSLVQGVRGDGLSDKELKFIANSDDPLKAVDFILAAAKNHESPKAVDSLAGRAESEITRADIKIAKGPERARLQKLAAIPAAGRLQAMLDDPSLAAESDRKEIAGIVRNLGADAEGAIAAKPFAGREEKFRNLAATDPGVRAQRQLRQAEIAKSAGKERGETQAITEAAIWAEEERMLAAGELSKGVVGQFMPAGAVSKADRAWYALNAGGYDKHADPNTWDPIVQKYEAAKESLERRMSGVGVDGKFSGGVDANALAKYAEALDKNTEATHQNTQSNNGGPALKNNSEGQK